MIGPRGRLAAGLGTLFLKMLPPTVMTGMTSRVERYDARYECFSGGDKRRKIGVALGDALQLSYADRDVQPRQWHDHLMGHEGAKLGEAKIVAVGFVEDLLSRIEGIHDQAGGGRARS